MQRQSLGGGSSPGSKHHHNIIHGGAGASSSKEVSKLFDDEEEEEEESKEEMTTPTTRKERGVVVVSEIVQEEVEKKKKKKAEKHRHHHHHHLRSSISSSARTEKSIHLIPILTIFCLLILYLCSYDPPLKDLAHIDGFRRISKRIDDSTDGLAGRFSSELDDDQINNKATDVLLPIRTHRSLHEIRKDGRKFHRLHRKIGDYSTVHTQLAT